jgi:hypothetical protein
LLSAYLSQINLVLSLQLLTGLIVLLLSDFGGQCSLQIFNILLVRRILSGFREQFSAAAWALRALAVSHISPRYLPARAICSWVAPYLVIAEPVILPLLGLTPALSQQRALIAASSWPVFGLLTLLVSKFLSLRFRRLIFLLLILFLA